jgi:hypothetical protein
MSLRLALRVTQGIHCFDPDVARAVAETPLTGELPAALLYHLPEWCVYVETPRHRWIGRPLHGFWAHLDFDVEGGADELRLLLDVAEAPELTLDRDRGSVPLPLILGDRTLADALKRMAESGRRRAQSLGMPSSAQERDAEGIAGSIAPLVSLLLYLCAEHVHRPNIENQMRQPRVKHAPGEISEPSVRSTRGGPLPGLLGRGRRKTPAGKPTSTLSGRRRRMILTPSLGGAPSRHRYPMPCSCGRRCGP